MIGRWVPGLLVLWDLVLVTVVATIAVQYRAGSVWDVLVGLGMAAALIVRRRAPVRVFAVVSALALVQTVVGAEVPAGFDLAVLVAMVAVVSHARPFWPAYLAGAVVVIGVGVVAVPAGSAGGSALDSAYLGEYVALLAACVALWLLAYVLRFNRERSAVLADRAATAERERDHLARLAAADERAAIARELHDVVAHSLAVMIAQADGASYAIDQDPGRAREAMRTVAGTGRDALEDMHRIVDVLRGTGEATSAPERRPVGVGELAGLAERARAAGLDVRVAIGELGRLTPAVELTVYRIVQEGLTNALRHAGPGARAEVTLELQAGGVVLVVADDGAAGSAEGGPVGAGGAAARSGGNGLVGMRERVAVHGGEFTAGPRTGGGWRLRASIPVTEAA